MRFVLTLLLLMSAGCCDAPKEAVPWCAACKTAASVVSTCRPSPWLCQECLRKQEAAEQWEREEREKSRKLNAIMDRQQAEERAVMKWWNDHGRPPLEALRVHGEDVPSRCQ
jgi:hypothetical protein